MDAFVNVLMTILFCGTPIFLWIQNVKQDDEIKKLNDKIKQFEAEKESLMEIMRTLCEQRDSIKKEIHDVFNKN